MRAKRSWIPDPLILIPTILLLCLGIVVLFTSDISLASQQLVVALIGIGLFWLFASINIQALTGYIWPAYILLLLLLVAVFILGIETRGSLRWIPLGVIRLQPSEFIKPVIILLLARFWSENYPSWKNIFKSGLIILPAVLLIFKQPDLGTAIIIVAIWLVMLLGTSISLGKLGVLGMIGVVLTPITWLFLRDYQRVRLSSFLNPERDPLGVGYNVIQSTIAVGSGQLFGRGLGRGTQSRLQFLPEFRTDFIFASIAEELGFIGSIIVLILYSILILRVFRLISLASSSLASLTSLGVMAMLAVQAVINIGMNLGIMPITGITLPLLSYGGSSLLTTLICLGLVASVSRFNQTRSDSD